MSNGAAAVEKSGAPNAWWSGPDEKPYKVIPLRSTGVTPEAVAMQLEEAMNDGVLDGWLLDRVEPIVYNSSTTGYLLLIFIRSSIGRA